MGKYTGKPNMTAEMDASHSSLGVRTRAKTLALQKLQAFESTAAPPTSPETENRRSESSYLQLRSRRLEKPPFQRLTCCRRQNPNPRIGNCSGGSNSVGSGEVETRIDENGEETEGGENDLDFDGRERSTRESTPCSSVNDFNALSTPGSRTRTENLEASNQISNNSTMMTRMTREIEEFFDVHEQDQQRWFADKYNFDFVNEKPLEGRYEWVKVGSE